MHIYCCFWHTLTYIFIFLAYISTFFAYLYIFPHFTIQVSMFNFSSILHPGRPRHCTGVYVPQLGPITLLSLRLRVTGPTVKVCSLSQHAEMDGSSVPHWNQWELGQDGCDGHCHWAEYIALACCSCAHRPWHSSPYQSNLEAKICRICKICI